MDNSKWYEKPEIIQNVAAIMRDADAKFKTTGGGTRHYVRELLLPMLDEGGMKIIALSESPSTSETVEPKYDKDQLADAFLAGQHSSLCFDEWFEKIPPASLQNK